MISKLQKKPFPDPKKHIPASSLADFLDEEVPAEGGKEPDLIESGVFPPVHSKNLEGKIDVFDYDQDIPFEISRGSSYRMSPEPLQPIFPGEGDIEDVLRQASEAVEGERSGHKHRDGKKPLDELRRNSIRWVPAAELADLEANSGTATGQNLGKRNKKSEITRNQIGEIQSEDEESDSDDMEVDGPGLQKGGKHGNTQGKGTTSSKLGVATGSGKGENQSQGEESESEEGIDPQTGKKHETTRGKGTKSSKLGATTGSGKGENQSHGEESGSDEGADPQTEGKHGKTRGKGTKDSLKVMITGSGKGKNQSHGEESESEEGTDPQTGKKHKKTREKLTKDGQKVQISGSENQSEEEDSDSEDMEGADPEKKGKHMKTKGKETGKEGEDSKQLRIPSSLAQSHDSSSNVIGRSSIAQSDSSRASKTEINPGQKTDSVTVPRPKYHLTENSSPDTEHWKGKSTPNSSARIQLASIKSERMLDSLGKEVRDKGNPLVQSQSQLFPGFEQESGKRDRIDQVFPEYEEHKRRKKPKKQPKKLKPLVKKPQLPPLALNGPGDIAGAYGIIQKKPAKKQSLPPLTKKSAN